MYVGVVSGDGRRCKRGNNRTKQFSAGDAGVNIIMGVPEGGVGGVSNIIYQVNGLHQGIQAVWVHIIDLGAEAGRVNIVGKQQGVQAG